VTAYRFIQKKLGQYTIKEMTALFGVSRGAYYKWLKKGCPSREKNHDTGLIDLIRKIVH